MGILKVPPRLFGLNRAGLQKKNAGDNLQAIGHPVAHLGEQHILLLAQAMKQPFRNAPVSDVLDCQQESCVQVALVKNLAGIEQHGTRANSWKILLNLEMVHDAMFGDNPLKQLAKRRIVPFARTQIIHQAPYCLRRGRLESRVK